MKKLDFVYLRMWIGEDKINKLEKERRRRGEEKRKRKLGTVEILLLSLAVAIYSELKSLHEILRLSTVELGIELSVSVAAFCKARARFSPQEFSSRVSSSCEKT